MMLFGLMTIAFTILLKVFPKFMEDNPRLFAETAETSFEAKICVNSSVKASSDSNLNV